MRTNIDIDEELMAEAMRLSGKKTKKETVDEILRDYVRRRKGVAALRALRGKIEWEGDLDAMRRDE
jgi:Arc/MetJ family transcription regulator